MSSRRQFIALLGGAAAAWPTVAAHAQQGERLRRIGVLMNADADSSQGRARFGALLKGLEEAGWINDRNVRIDVRWGSTANPDTARKHAAELTALAPDVILSSGNPSTEALQQATRTIPIVFAMTVDPVGNDLVDSLPKPGSNTTGFMQFEYSLSGKWLELLKQIAPDVTRAAVLRDPRNPTGIGQFAVIQTVAPLLGMEVIPVNVRDAAEIERRITAFARSGNAGLVVTGGAAVLNRDQILKLAVQHRLPTVFPYRYYVDVGGLISYGPNLPELFRQAAGYLNRILKGERPANLPVQAPTKYELVINLKTAKAMGLDVPPTVLVRADEVIE